MRSRRRTTVAFVVLGLGGLAALASAWSAVAQPGAKAFTIRSSLDGRKVLPHRIRWIAYPSAPVVFPGVEFLIDGKVVFANRLEPYAFGDDGRDEASQTVKTGYLVTSWLAPGKHTFTVRARRNPDRVTESRTLVARVPAAPAPPAALAGTWTRTLPEPVPPDRGVLYRVTAPAGPYRITIDRRYVRVDGPQSPPHGKAEYTATPTTLRLGGPVWTGNRNEVGLCDPWGPDAAYSWSVTDRTLTLEPAADVDPCRQRGAIFAGEWTRVN
jgi:hypothetical protein